MNINSYLSQYMRLIYSLVFFAISFSAIAQDTFTGNVFLDHNQNGVFNGPDYVHPAIHISAYDDTNNNGVFDNGDLLISKAITNVDGDYTLSLDVSGSTISKSLSVQASSDDAEEEVSDGNMGLTSSDLEMAFEDGSTEQIVGIRFDGIALPPNVNVTSAYIRFEAKADNDGSCDLKIWGEKNINSLAFSNTDYDISDRDTTTNSVSWSPGDWDDNSYYNTPSLISLVEELNSMTEWSVESAVTFIITGTGEREPWSFDGSGDAPELFIEYDNPYNGSRYFIVLDSKELISGASISLPGSEHYTYNSGLGASSNVDFAFYGETLLCYGMSDGGVDSGLSAMSRATGDNFLIGLSGESDIEASCFDPYSRKYYAAKPDQLGTIDLSTGVFTDVSSSDFGTGSSTTLGASEDFDDVDGLAFDPITGILWGTVRDGGWDLLIQIDHTTGEFIPDAFGTGEDYVEVKDIGENMPGDIDDIGINPENGKLYGIANTSNFDLLVEINKLTGIAVAIDTLRKSNGDFVQDVEGFGFTNFGLLLAVTGDGSSQDDSQWSIDLSTAVATYIGTYEYGSDYESCDCLTAATNNIDGTVFNDIDGDGQIDGGENGLQNVTVYFYIDTDNDGQIDGGDILVDSTDTDSNGDWSFEAASNVDMLFIIDEGDLPVSSIMTTNNLEMAFFNNAFGGQTDSNNNYGYNFTGPDTDKDGIVDSSDIDDDNDGIPDVNEAYSGDHDSDGTPDAEDAEFCTLYFQGVNGWNCSNGLPDPSGDLNSDGTDNYRDSSFPYCGGLNSFGICTNYDKDSDGVPDHLDLDADNDGIPDLIEVKGIDIDGDGRTDTGTDTDGDGLADIFDNNDTDGPTGSGSDPSTPSTSVLLDSNGDGLTDSGDTDNDTHLDFLDLDADNDGIPDLVEAGGIDTDGNGRVDASHDDDGDGYVDTYDSDEDDIVGDEDLGTPLIETNGSGEMIFGETGDPADTDGDGLADHIDLDADNDGIPDIIEAGGNDPGSDGMVSTSGNWDQDGDGLSDLHDQDASDGIWGTGTDGTALIKTSSDSNSDFRVNSSETMVTGGSNTINSDSDNTPNHLDLDSDNDGITDVVENAAGDTDADNGGSGDLDGTVDNYIDVADNNGWNDSSTSTTLDTDGDGLPDYIDIDSENDGIPDYIEGVCTTCPSAGGPSGIDTDGNGVLDIFENMSNDNTDNSGGSNVGTSPNLDDDDLIDTVPDYLDTDTDEDGAFDWSEGFNTTTGTNATDDIVAIAASYETANGNPGHYSTTDTDSDGLPDWLDNDPANSGYTQNQRPPFLDESDSFWRDANNNGLVDLFDPAVNGTLATTPDENSINDDDWRDNSSLIYLPVELDYFAGGSEDCNIWLSWETSSETNFRFFEVQHSRNGITYTPVETIQSGGSPDGNKYFFEERARGFANYYRLKIVDHDGSFEYSEVVIIEADCGNNITNIKVYPNPAQAGIDNINIVPNNLELNTSLALTNLEGKVLYRIFVESGAISMSVNGLPPGIYFITGKNGERRFAEKVVLVEQ